MIKDEDWFERFEIIGLSKKDKEKMIESIKAKLTVSFENGSSNARSNRTSVRNKDGNQKSKK